MVTDSEDSLTRSDEPLLDEAAEWIARLRAADVGVADRVAFSRWLERSPAHKYAFDSMADLWDGLGVVPADEPTALSAMPARGARSEKRWRPAWLLGVGGLGGATALALLAIWMLILAPSVFVTGPGERLQVELDDGSILELNTRSKVRVSMQSEQRHLRAELGSEFFLRVAPDPDRPFVIHTHHGIVEVLGTELAVLHQDSRTRVSVTSGQVAVMPHGIPAAGRQVIRAGQMLEISAGLEAGRPEAAAPAHLGWRDGRLVYEQVTLEELIEDLNRYLPKRMTLVAPELGRERLSAVLQLRHQEAMLESLAATLPLRWIEVSDNLILIHPG